MSSSQSRQASAEPELFSRQTSALHMASKPDRTSRQLQQLQGSTSGFHLMIPTLQRLHGHISTNITADSVERTQ